jgi:hypothetical protein
MTHFQDIRNIKPRTYLNNQILSFQKFNDLLRVDFINRMKPGFIFIYVFV